jgi:phenylpropionate dioxygenase-like ring-hydroxylating dioxygenase large terminal subunit
MSCLGLESFKIEVCGTLVFVNLEKGSQSLQDYLGNFYNELVSMSSSFGELIDVNNMTIKANWKILVENTLESYHVNLIHTDTFRKLGASGIEFNFNSLHSRWDAPLLYNENDGKQEKVHRPFQNRSYKITGYKHLICFPNILISTTYGISFNLSIITPIDENSSSFTSYVFLSNGIDEEHNKPLLHAYKESLINFNRQVFDEDKVICEHVQVGVTASLYDGELSDEEMRVCAFQKSYAMLMCKKF